MPVSLQFSGDSKDAEKAFQALVRENTKLREDMGKTAQANKAAAKEQQQSNDVSLAGLTKLAGGLFTVEKATSAVVAVYREWAQEQKQLVDQAEKLSKSTIRALAGSGDLAQGQRISQFLQTLPGATPEEGLTIFDQLRGAMPTEELERILALTKETAPLAQVFDPTQIGRMVGELADTIPDKAAGDLVDFAATVLQNAGADAGKLVEDGFLRAVKILEQTGMSVEEAFGMGLAALDAHLNPKIIEQLAALIEEPPQLTDADRRTEAGQFKAMFAASAPQERLDMLLTDPQMLEAMVPGVKGHQVALLDHGKAAEQAQAIRDAMQADARFQFGRDVAEQFPTDFAQRERELKFRELEAQRAPAARERATAGEQLQLQLEEQGAPRWWAKFRGAGHTFDLNLAAFVQEMFGGSRPTGDSGGASLTGIERWLNRLAGLTEEQNALLRSGANRPVVGEHVE